MFLLAIDTSRPHGILALAEGDAADLRLLEEDHIEGGTFSAQLVPGIAGLLERRRLRLSHLACLAVCVGPGSFTGLRVGLAAAKGLAEVAHVPLVGVSALAALASCAGQEGLILAVSDARRNEVFVGEYRCRGSDCEREAEYLCSIADLSRRIETLAPAAVVTADGPVAVRVRSLGHPMQLVETPGGAVLARIGLARFLRGATVAVDGLDAEYLRRDDNLFFPHARRS
jgi:tRNA threonylcarbamoyladenosine biosynthesis protein TsaB